LISDCEEISKDFLQGQGQFTNLSNLKKSWTPLMQFT